ncbi:MAG: hypothetical protein U5L95_00825 [Candidatus Saccharibacteria bacterium]|nr:hypothetical protein [Candidatus Saccharibacteria bacterium]MDZ7785653.1 hypothetical protein [Candidatus Saccharibacteria bacterium]
MSVGEGLERTPMMREPRAVKSKINSIQHNSALNSLHDWLRMQGLEGDDIKVAFHGFRRGLRYYDGQEAEVDETFRGSLVLDTEKTEDFWKYNGVGELVSRILRDTHQGAEDE